MLKIILGGLFLQCNKNVGGVPLLNYRTSFIYCIFQRFNLFLFF